MEAEVEAESRIHELQLRVEELEKLREVDHAELAALRESEQAAVSELDKVKEENSKLVEQVQEAQENSKNAAQAKEKAEAEKRDLLEALSRSDSDKQQLENNLAELQAAHSATLASLRSMEASYSSATENERSYKLRLQGLEGELSILRKDRDWNHEELLRVTDESTKDRREKNAQISALQIQLDAAVQSSESATASLAALRTSHATLEGRLSEAQARISTLTSQLADNEASFRAEISTAQRLTDLLEKREVETKNRLDEVEKEWQAAREEMQETREAYEAELEKEKARGDALEERVREMRDFADRLAATGGPSLGNISSISQSDDVFNGSTGSPRSSSVADVSFRVQKSGGMSYTEIYSSYVKMQEALVFEKAESKRLSECLNDILAEIQDRAPLLREQRIEYDRAVAENNDLSVALASALEDKDAVTTLAEARLRQIEEKDREAAISAQQLEDTARQVRTLTRQVAILQDPSILERSAGDDEDAIAEESESADAYISQNLVTFKSIDQLQKQNQNLLKIVRELGKKMEAEEQAVRDRIGRAENTAVEEAHDLILSLKEEVETQRAQMGAYQRERDMLRQVLKSRGHQSIEEGEESSAGASTSQGGSNAARVALEEVQRNFEAYKREMVIDNQSLRDDLSLARKEVANLQIQVARSGAEKEYAEERLKTLRNSNERVEKELAGMSKRNLELQSNMARLDDATRRVSEEVYELKSSLDRAKHEAMMLKAEKEVWKNVEARLTEDNASLAKERSHMSDLMRNLQAMHNELDRTGNEARQRLEENVARLNKELEATKDRLGQEVEAGRQIALRRELESRDLQDKIEKITAEYHETREAYLNAKNTSERAVERSEAMQRQVAAYEEKLAVYEGRRSQSSEGASSLSREQQLETQLADIRAELGTAKMEAEQARSHVEQYKSIAQAHEQALAELNATYDEYKRSMDASVAQKEDEISALQERVQALTNDLTASTDENSQLHRQLQNQKSQFEQEQQANLDTIANLRHFESQIEAVRAASKSDLEAQLRRANEAHDRYQAEVVAHAEDVQALAAARKELAAIQSALLEATNKAETAQANLNSSEASWTSQREALQKEIDEQNKRCEDLVAQNSILHDHLENVSKQAALIKQVAEGQDVANTEGGESAAPSSEANTVEELHAVIRYVRRERDVAELRLHLSKQEESRMRQQLEQANKRLDELTATLATERQQAASQSASAVQHAELMQKIQSLNLLRESNETLRREAEAYLERVKDLEARLRETELELSPLREQVRVFQAEIEARDRNITMLEEDNARWKTRTQQILQKYERIDPAELASLKEELEKVKAALAEAEKERNAEKTRAEAIQTDLQDANTRAEASQNRFKSLQKIAREHRDNHTAAQAEFEKQKAELQAEVERLNAAKADLETQLSAAQSSTAEASAADGETLKKVEAERDALQSQLQSLKEEIATMQEQAGKSKEEEEAGRKKLEEDMALQTRRNTALLNDNKKFRAQIQELNAKINTSVEEEVQKRMAAMPQTTEALSTDQESVKAQLSELETRLKSEKEDAVKAATQEVESRLREEFAQERSKLLSEAVAGAGGSEDAESIQKRIDEAANARVVEAVRLKEEELNKVKASEIAEALSKKEQELKSATQAQADQAKKQVEAAAQARINNLAKQHKEAVEKLQKSHDEQLKTAVEEARAAASNQEAGEIASGTVSQEDLDKAVKEALDKKEQEYQKSLAEKVAEAKEKAKTEFDLKSKLRDSQIAALRKETAGLKAKLAQTTSSETASSPQLPSTPAQPTTVAAATPVANGSPIKGLSIAGRSQSQGSVTPAAAPAATPTVLSIAGASAATPVQRGRGRGRGPARGIVPGSGRGRGNIVGTALSAATDGGAKRAREDEAADGEAKRRKDGEA